MDEKAAAKDWSLLKSAINGHARPRNNVFIVNVGSDSDDAVRRAANPGHELNHGIRPIDMPINGILIGKHSLCESLADDDDRLLVLLSVKLIEIAPGEDGNAKRRKESRRNSPQLGARIIF